MAAQDVMSRGTQRGMPHKRRAIADAARLVFGREGYTRTSVDAIAAEAGVSKRTIYNHYAGKEQLFLSVALEGAAEVTETIAAIAHRHLHTIDNLEGALIAFAIERASALLSAVDHFALVRTIHAEADRIPPQMLEAWLEAGPRASHRDIARYLRRIADRGMLVIRDDDEATNHFTLLTFTNVADRSFYGAIPLPDAEIAHIASSGVRTFLRLYRPEPD